MFVKKEILCRLYCFSR